MYYQNLMSIKGNLSANEDIVNQMLKSLDQWLASLSFQRLERINPYQFSLDYNYNERDVLKIFLEGAKKNLFRITYEVRNDENEYISVISDKQYRALHLEGKPLILYSRYSDNEEEFFSHNIEIWFGINMTPSRIPEVLDVAKKAEASPLTGDNKNNDLFMMLMER